MYPFDHQNILEGFQNPQLLSRGGQKVVYKASHPLYGVVALKIGQYSHPDGLERIKREVSLLRNINSVYYPKTYDFQVLPPDKFVIIEEYINSQPLSKCLTNYSQPKDALILLKHLVIGLRILWDQNVVHRDIKPDNILILSDQSPKIIDLGIARLLDLDSLTRTLAMLGPCTPLYAAPEQLQNRKTDINFRTDQFSLGIVVLQLLLSGNHPFDPNIVKSGNTTVENIINGNWAKTTLRQSKFAGLQNLIIKLLGREPYQRFRTDTLLMSEIDKALEAYL